jgi:pimeloyl-ACP methyl ester carboxylesterase
VGPVEVPTLYVWSSGDAALGRPAAESTAAHVRGPYRFEVLSGSHWIPETRGEALSQLVLEHVRTSEEPGRPEPGSAERR